MLSSLLLAADNFNAEALESVLIGGLRHDTGRHAQQSLLKRLFQGLFGHAEFMDLVFARAQQHSQQKLEPLTRCFDSESRLALWDEWLAQKPPSTDVLPDLALTGERSSASAILYQRLSRAALAEVLTDSLIAQVAVAGCIHAHVLDSLAVAELDVLSAVELLTADLDNPRWAAELQTHLTAFAKSEVARLMIERLPGVSRTYGGVQMAAAMGSLGWAEFVPCLIDAMADDQGDFMCEAAQLALIEIGEPAQKELIARWNQLDQTQRIYGLSIISDIGGTLAADFADTHFDDLMDSAVESCCELLLAAPDERLLERLRPELRRRQALIDRAYAILSGLLDRDDEDAQQARQRALDDYRRSRQLRSAFDAGNFARDSLSLQLKCPSCGAVNGYDVAGVITKSERQSDVPDMVDDEFPCASCGAIVEFEFTADAKMALTGELIRMMASRDSGEDGPSLIRLLDCQIDGKVMPIAAGIQLLRQRISANPKDVGAWFQLGNLLSHIKRPQGTLAVYQQASLLAPNAVNVALQLAHHLTKIGHESEAIEVMLAVLERKQSWTYVGGHQNVGQAFVALYSRLRESLGRNDLPALHPASLPTPKQVGRNDPCPCGSGKKFKKCCG